MISCVAGCCSAVLLDVQAGQRVYPGLMRALPRPLHEWFCRESTSGNPVQQVRNIAEDVMERCRARPPIRRLWASSGRAGAGADSRPHAALKAVANAQGAAPAQGVPPL